MNSYKNAMDKIVLSDEEKEKIIKNALLKTKARKRPVYKYAANIAAGVIICLISIPATEFLLKPAPDYVPAITLTPSPTETPSVLSPLASDALPAETDAADKPVTEKEAQAPKVTERPVSKTRKSASKSSPVRQTAPSPAAEQISDTPAVQISSEQIAAPVAVTAVPEVAEEAVSSGANARTALPRAAARSESESEIAVPAAVSFDDNEETDTCETAPQNDYTDSSSQFVYRTQSGSGNYLGNENEYEKSEEFVCGDKHVTVKTDESLGTLIVWNDNDTSFSLHTDTILTPEEVSDIMSDF